MIRIKNLIWATDKEINLIKNKKLDKVLIFTNLVSILLFLSNKKETALKFAIFSIKLAAVLRIVYAISLLLAIIISNL